MAANDVIGKISFQAPDEGTGTDAILISGAIQARAEGDHSSSSNATSLDFMTGASEAAATKMTLTSGGNLDVSGHVAVGKTGTTDANVALTVVGGDDGSSNFIISGYNDSTVRKFSVRNDGLLTAVTLAGSGAGLTAGTTPVTTLDIDGATDIGEAIVDADLFIVDNGAGGTNRKTTASRLKTYIGSISQANQAALEAQTNEDTYAPPDLMHHHPGMVKAWCKWDIAVTVNASHNVSSVTDSATGLWTINWNTDFSSVNYAVACSWRDDNDKVEFQCSGGSSAAGTYEFKLVNGGGSLVDAAAADDMHVIALGDH